MSGACDRVMTAGEFSPLFALCVCGWKGVSMEIG